MNDDAACVKLTSSQFNDYLAMVRIEGQWKIVNVLWTFGSDSPNRKQLADFKGDGEKHPPEDESGCSQELGFFLHSTRLQQAWARSRDAFHWT